MEFIKLIVDNPIYTLLFGGGGILIIAVNIMIYLKNDKNNKNNKNNINNDTSQKPSVTHIGVDNTEDYEECDFNSDEFYIRYLKTIEEKKKGKDKIEYD